MSGMESKWSLGWKTCSECETKDYFNVYDLRHRDLGIGGFYVPCGQCKRRIIIPQGVIPVYWQERIVEWSKGNFLRRWFKRMF